MSEEYVNCLYCQTKNSSEDKNCSNCGMPLPEEQPEGTKSRLANFKKFFWAIVIFCVVMMYYLPR